MKKNADFESDLYLMDKITGEEIHGVTHAQTIGNTENFVGSYLVECRISPVEFESRKRRETRAYREMSRRAREAVPKIKKSALRDELVILPGAGMSAADVVGALKRYIKEVEEKGMWIGRSNSQYIIERVDGRLEEG